LANRSLHLKTMLQCFLPCARLYQGQLNSKECHIVYCREADPPLPQSDPPSKKRKCRKVTPLVKKLLNGMPRD